MKTTKTVPCPTCAGTGVDPDDPFIACDICLGQAHIDVNAREIEDDAPRSIPDAMGYDLEGDDAGEGQ